MRVITLLFALFFVSALHANQVYKWTDEKGQTHFSQFPPEQSQSENIADHERIRNGAACRCCRRIAIARWDDSGSIVSGDEQ